MVFLIHTRIQRLNNISSKNLNLYDVYALCSEQQIEQYMCQLRMNLGVHLTDTKQFFFGGGGKEEGVVYLFPSLPRVLHVFNPSTNSAEVSFDARVKGPWNVAVTPNRANLLTPHPLNTVTLLDRETVES